MISLILLALLCQSPRIYTIAGTIEDSVTGKPLAKAHVQISPAYARPVVTGPDGAFSFTGLPARKYGLAAERIGYTVQRFGQRGLFQNGSSGVVTGMDQSTDHLVFRLIPSSVIAGTVTTPGGDPLPGMTVVALQISGIGVRRRAFRRLTGTTDDRGYYRIPSLADGTFAVVVSGQPQDGMQIPSVDDVGFPQTFYPGTTDPDQAGFLTVKPGEEARADLVVRPVPVGSIAGSSPGLPASGVFATLNAPSLFASETPMGPSAWAFNGRFSFARVPAGRYLIRLIGASNLVVGSARIDVGPGENTVTVNPSPLPHVNVHVSMLGQSKAPNSPVLVRLLPVEGTSSPGAMARDDGLAVIPQALRGRYEVMVALGPARLAIASMKAQGAAVMGTMVDIPDSGIVDIDVAADADAGDIQGHVTRDGIPQPGVIAMLVQRDTWQYTASFRFDQADSDGSFTWKGVPKGEYLMFAFDQGVPEDYDDPEAIRKFLPIAQPLTVTGDPAQTANLKLLSMPSDK